MVGGFFVNSSQSGHCLVQVQKQELIFITAEHKFGSTGCGLAGAGAPLITLAVHHLQHIVPCIAVGLVKIHYLHQFTKMGESVIKPCCEIVGGDCVRLYILFMTAHSLPAIGIVGRKPYKYCIIVALVVALQAIELKFFAGHTDNHGLVVTRLCPLVSFTFEPIGLASGVSF